MSSHVPLALIFLFLLTATHSVPLIAQRRIVTPSDFLKLEELSDIAIAPEGHTAAVVRHRPLFSGRDYDFDRYGADDVWLIALDSGDKPVNLTRGEVDGSSYWMPVWSPDGMRLAMLCRERSGNMRRLCLWEKATGRLTQLSNHGIARTGIPEWNTQNDKPFIWVDNYRIAVFVLSDAEQQSDELRRHGTIAMREWPKAWIGRDSTASVLDSGFTPDLSLRPQQQLIIFDVTGKSKPLASAASFVDLQLAPDGRHLAYLKQVTALQPDPAKILVNVGRYGFFGGLSRYSITIADIQQDSVQTEPKGVRFVVPQSFRWSRDGHSFAFIGVRDGEEEGPLSLFQGSPDNIVKTALLPDCDPQSLMWSNGDRLLASAKKKNRLDWWLISRGAAPRNITEGLKVAPGDLISDPTGKAFFGIAEGELWRLDSVSISWTKLTATFDPKISAISWPKADAAITSNVFDSVVVSVPTGMFTDFYRVDIASGAMSKLGCPSEFAWLATYIPKANLALFTAKESTGTYLTVVQGESQRQGLERNTLLRNLKEGEIRKIEYQGLDGEKLKGWIILPVGYEAGKHYPLVTWVYAGNVQKDMPPTFSRLNDVFVPAWNLQLLAARGYAVLLPSMPLKVPEINQGEMEDPYLELKNGVL